LGKPHHGDHATETTEQPEQVGVQLRLAREAQHISIATAAASLHLPRRAIEALEANDFKQFEPVYARGYLRNYARLLELNAEPLIESYNQTLIPEHQPPSAQKPTVEEQPSRKSGILLLALVGLPLLLWMASKSLQIIEEWRNPQQGTGRTTLSAAPLQDAASAPDLVLPGQEQASTPSPEPSKPSVNNHEPAAVSSDKPATAEPAPTAVTTAPVAVAEPTNQTPAPTQPPASATPPSVAPPPIGTGPDNITVRLPGSAWVSIRDHAGHRLEYESLPAGTERSYQGLAPFAVVLGNYSPSTQISFNGQPSPPPKAKAGTVARFTVGQISNKPNP